jgi:type I restriction enzyme S subunit
MSFPMVALGEVLTPVSRPESVDPEKEYRILGAHWYAEGLYIKNIKLGSGIQANKVYRIENGDFVYNRLFAWKGSFAVATNENHGCYVSNEFPCFKVDSDRADSKYLWLYFSRAKIWEEAFGLSTGGTPTSRNRLKEEKFLAMQISLPPLSEQRRIVARIEELAAKIGEARGLRMKAGEEIEALFESAVGTIFNQLNLVERKKLSTLTSKIGSGSTPTGGRATYPSSGIPFIRSLNVRMRNFQWDGIAFIDKTTHGIMKGTQVKPNDVLLNITGASIGRVACAPSDLAEANVNQHVAIIRPIETLYTRYLMYWLSQPSIQEFINDEQKGATRQGFTKAQIETFEVPLPPLPEQLRIVAYLDALQAKVDTLRRLQAQTGAEMDALMPAVLERAFMEEL